MATPSSGKYESNRDAGINKLNGKIGIKVIIRDHHRSFVTGLSTQKNIWALLEAVKTLALESHDTPLQGDGDLSSGLGR